MLVLVFVRYFSVLLFPFFNSENRKKSCPTDIISSIRKHNFQHFGRCFHSTPLARL